MAEKVSVDSVVAIINGEEVSIHEFSERMKSNRAYVYNLFIQHYKADPDSFSWHTSYSGKTPWEVLKEKAMSDLVLRQVQLLLMKKKGIVNDISYTHFLQELSEVNRARKESVKRGEVIYGPITYSESNYYEHCFQKNVSKLKDALGANEFNASEEILHLWYDSLKTALFKKAPRLEVEIYSISTNETNNEKTASSLFYQILNEYLHAGISGTNLVEEVNSNTSYKLTVQAERRVIDLNDRSNYERNSFLLQQLANTAAGEWKNITNEEGDPLVVLLLHHMEQGYSSFEESKKIVKARYLNFRYECMLSRLIESAHVEINQRAMNELSIQ